MVWFGRSMIWLLSTQHSRKIKTKRSPNVYEFLDEAGIKVVYSELVKILSNKPPSGVKGKKYIYVFLLKYLNESIKSISIIKSNLKWTSSFKFTINIKMILSKKYKHIPILLHSK